MTYIDLSIKTDYSRHLYSHRRFYAILWPIKQVFGKPICFSINDIPMKDPNPSLISGVWKYFIPPLLRYVNTSFANYTASNRISKSPLFLCLLRHLLSAKNSIYCAVSEASKNFPLCLFSETMFAEKRISKWIALEKIYRGTAFSERDKNPSFLS